MILQGIFTHQKTVFLIDRATYQSAYHPKTGKNADGMARQWTFVWDDRAIAGSVSFLHPSKIFAFVNCN